MTPEVHSWTEENVPSISSRCDKDSVDVHSGTCDTKIDTSMPFDLEDENIRLSPVGTFNASNSIHSGEDIESNAVDIKDGLPIS